MASGEVGGVIADVQLVDGVGMFQDDKGNTSSMRVMSCCSLLEAMILGAYIAVNPPADPSTGLYIFTAFLIAAFAPKAVQKFVETKYK